MNDLNRAKDETKEALGYLTRWADQSAGAEESSPQELRRALRQVTKALHAMEVRLCWVEIRSS